MLHTKTVIFSHAKSSVYFVEKKLTKIIFNKFIIILVNYCIKLFPEKVAQKNVIIFYLSEYYHLLKLIIRFCAFTTATTTACQIF
jgi:hypothetical protein